eukprot:COSAG01_NODE_4446_length_5014_cov_27.756867_3_plen_122_part_00
MWVKDMAGDAFGGGACALCQRLPHREVRIVCKAGPVQTADHHRQDGGACTTTSSRPSSNITALGHEHHTERLQRVGALLDGRDPAPTAAVADGRGDVETEADQPHHLRGGVAEGPARHFFL